MRQHQPEERAPDDGQRAAPDADDRAKLAGLANTSDSLLGEVAALREVESRKRHATVSSPEFHELAREVEARAKQVWRTAATEVDEGNRIDTQPGISTNDAEQLDGGRGEA